MWINMDQVIVIASVVMLVLVSMMVVIVALLAATGKNSRVLDEYILKKD